MTTFEILDNAVKAKKSLAFLTEEKKNKALLLMADAIEADTVKILEANKKDVEASKDKISEVMIDRLKLTEQRIKAMADGIREVVALPDPVGKVMKSFTRPSGIEVKKVRVPMGVVSIIYESRPNVTSDAAALCLKSGNVCVLRGGKEAFNSAFAITEAMRRGIEKAGLEKDLVQLVTDTTRESANVLMTAVGKVDLLIPRGGAGLINACVQNAKVPCIQTGTGICHIYVDKSANLEKALNIIENAKTSRPSVCNAEEVCLVHKNIISEFLPRLKERLCDKRMNEGKIPVRLKLDEIASQIVEAEKAEEKDFDTEFLDYILAVGTVDSLDDAIEHISLHSTHHSDAIVTEDKEAAEIFTACVDSAAVYVNASTRFTDGGEFGLGCEMGISTQKLHARGPMGLEELTSYKYIVHGNGTVR